MNLLNLLHALFFFFSLWTTDEEDSAADEMDERAYEFLSLDFIELSWILTQCDGMSDISLRRSSKCFVCPMRNVIYEATMA